MFKGTYGLVNKVVPLRELMPIVMVMAIQLSSGAPLSLRYAKEAVCQGLDLTLEQGLHLEADLYHLLQTTEDRIEALKLFNSGGRLSSKESNLFSLK